MSKEARRKMSLAKIGKVSNRYGKHHTEKTKKVLAEKSKGNESHAKIWNIIHKGKHIVVKNLQNFCKENGYKYSTIYYRINRGIEI